MGAGQIPRPSFLSTYLAKAIRNSDKENPSLLAWAGFRSIVSIHLFVRGQWHQVTSRVKAFSNGRKSRSTSLETLVTDNIHNALFCGGVEESLLLKHSGAQFQNSMSFWKEARFFTSSFRLESLMRQFPCSQACGRKGGDTQNIRLEYLEPTLSVSKHSHIWSFTPLLYKLLMVNMMLHLMYEEAKIFR